MDVEALEVEVNQLLAQAAAQPDPLVRFALLTAVSGEVAELQRRCRQVRSDAVDGWPLRDGQARTGLARPTVHRLQSRG